MRSPATPNQVMCIEGVLHAEAVGNVLWPIVVSQPDASYAVSFLSQFIQNPGQAHWETHIIVFLGCTNDLWLTFGVCTTILVERYCNADWQARNTGIPSWGYSFHLRNGAMPWSLKKQYLIALLSSEAKYITQTHVAKEALWL